MTTKRKRKGIKRSFQEDANPGPSILSEPGDNDGTHISVSVVVRMLKCKLSQSIALGEKPVHVHDDVLAPESSV